MKVFVTCPLPGDANERVSHHVIADLVAAPHHGSDHGTGSVALVLHGFV